MKASSAPELQVSRDGALTRVWLNRPEAANALSPALVEALSGALEVAAGDGTRLLAICSSGKHFCTGFDLSNLDDQSDDLLLARLVRIELMLQRLQAAPFATVAIASGRVVGAGADIFAACESRWIAGAATFAFPGAGFGLVLGTGRLGALVGSSVARDWVSSGRTIDTDSALSSGLATFRAEPPEVDASLFALSESMLRLDAWTHAAVRRASLARGDAGQAADLAALVESAARPGLKARIMAYRQAATVARSTSSEQAMRQG